MAGSDRTVVLSVKGKSKDVSVTIINGSSTKQTEHVAASKFKAVKLKVKKGAKVAILVRNWGQAPAECVMTLQGKDGGELRKSADEYGDRADCAATIP